MLLSLDSYVIFEYLLSIIDYAAFYFKKTHHENVARGKAF